MYRPSPNKQQTTGSYLDTQTGFRASFMQALGWQLIFLFVMIYGVFHQGQEKANLNPNLVSEWSAEKFVKTYIRWVTHTIQNISQLSKGCKG